MTHAWEDIVQFQKVWYPRNQLVEIFQVKVVPKKIKKLGAPYYTAQLPIVWPGFVYSTAKNCPQSEGSATIRGRYKL